MPNRHRRRALETVSLLVAALCLVGAPTSGQQGDLELAVRLSKKTVMVGEPVVLQLALTNRGKEPVQFRAMAIYTQTMRYFVRAGSGEWRQYEWPQVTDPQMPIELRPGAQSFADQTLHYDFVTGDLLFPVPGSYAIRAEYVGWVSRRPTPAPTEVQLQVVAATPAETEGAALFSRKEVARFIAGMSRDQSVAQRLEAFSAAHPGTTFAAYAKYYAANYIAAQYSDKPADFARAIDVIRDADVEGFPLRPMVMLNLAQWLSRTGKATEARTYLDRLLKTDPQSYAGEQARMLQSRLLSPK